MHGRVCHGMHADLSASDQIEKKVLSTDQSISARWRRLLVLELC